MKTSTQRPLSVLLIGWLYIVAGSVGLVYHAGDFARHRPAGEVFLVLLIRLAAVAGGIFLLRGRNWARWLVVLWMGYHVMLSAFHALGEMLMHALLLTIIAFFLFKFPTREFFRRFSI